MQIKVCFFSYFRELTGCGETTEMLPSGGSIGMLLQKLFDRFPKLVPMKNSMLVAVGLEYQDRTYVLNPGDEVSLFPPVQGG